MGANLPKFNSRDGEDKDEPWLVEIEKTFHVIELSDRLKARYDTYKLESWWRTYHIVRYGDVHLE